MLSNSRSRYARSKVAIHYIRHMAQPNTAAPGVQHRTRPIAVLFNLDGTLIDSIGLLLASVKHAFEGFTGRSPTQEEWVAGIGTPLAIASIKTGETVLDLGSGAGFDCFLAARQLAGTGRVIGVDMTAAMITKARANAVKGGYSNVEFRLGEIEALPVPDATVELSLAICVCNRSPEKHRVSKLSSWLTTNGNAGGESHPQPRTATIVAAQPRKHAKSALSQ